MALEAGSPRSRLSQARFLLRSLLGLGTADFFLCFHMVFAACVCVLVFSSNKDAGHSGLGPTLMTSF